MRAMPTSPYVFNLILSLIVGRAVAAFSSPHLPSSTSDALYTRAYPLVQSVDELDQRSTSGTRIPPPHLFRFAAPGGDVCLIMDEKGAYHAVRDAFPPLGRPVSDTGVVDTQVNAIGDTLFGTRFHLSDGTVRGPWCPGGTAGIFLRIARRMPSRLRQALRLRKLRPRRYAPAESSQVGARTLEVLRVVRDEQGGLSVMLPCAMETRMRKREVAEDPGVSKDRQRSWVEACGLAGYQH